MKTIGTCKDCKWWGEKTDLYGVCTNDRNDKDFDHADSANPRDIHQLAVRIFPGPDFGCIHWEQKPQPLITIEESQKRIKDSWSKPVDLSPVLIGALHNSGISCPECGKEMQHNGSFFGYGPFSNGIQCECGLKGHINSFSGEFTKLP